jgi:hypothetical protein
LVEMYWYLCWICETRLDKENDIGFFANMQR